MIIIIIIIINNSSNINEKARIKNNNVIDNQIIFSILERDSER
jgi:hypothetical protein